MESKSDMLRRVRMMADGNPTWDLSDNDTRALQHVLAERHQFKQASDLADKRIRELETELAEAREDSERLEKARSILFAYSDNEITAHPWWAVVRNGSFGHMVVLDGPFFSRVRATELLEARRYEYGAKAYVFCFSGARSQHYIDLRNALGARAAIDAARKGE